VELEAKASDSLLNWSKQLIALRRSNAALRDGGFVMLNHDPSILTYMRTAPTGNKPVLVMMNTTAKAATTSADLRENGVSATNWMTLLSSDPAISGTHSLRNMTIAPYGTWIATPQ
jgi:alpha-glucosidase